MPAETAEQDSFILGRSPFEDVFSEGTGGSAVEDAVFAECFESVGFQDFRPFIRIVTSAVAAVEDMSESRTLGCARHGRQRPVRGQDAALEIDRTLFGKGFQRMPGHVDEAELELTHLIVGGKVVTGADNALHQGFG